MKTSQSIASNGHMCRIIVIHEAALQLRFAIAVEHVDSLRRNAAAISLHGFGIETRPVPDIWILCKKNISNGCRIKNAGFGIVPVQSVSDPPTAVRKVSVRQARVDHCPCHRCFQPPALTFSVCGKWITDMNHIRTISYNCIIYASLKIRRFVGNIFPSFW